MANDQQLIQNQTGNEPKGFLVEPAWVAQCDFTVVLFPSTWNVHFVLCVPLKPYKCQQMLLEILGLTWPPLCACELPTDLSALTGTSLSSLLYQMSILQSLHCWILKLLSC